MRVVGYKQSYYYPKQVAEEKPKAEATKTGTPKAETVTPKTTAKTSVKQLAKKK